MTHTPLILADSIARRDARRGQALLQPTRFALRAGERVAITGPSGSGKSVFLRALALLDPLDAGRIMWHGAPVERGAIPRYRRNVAYIRQRPALLDGSVEDCVAYLASAVFGGAPVFIRATSGASHGSALRLLGLSGGQSGSKTAAVVVATTRAEVEAKAARK